MLSVRCNSHIKSKEMEKNPERITKIKLFINKWEGINFLSKKDDWKKN